MEHIKAPAEKRINGIWHDKVTIFMAGGITKVRDWQDDLVAMLSQEEVILFNPRRDDFDVFDEDMSKAQIEWEFEYLNTVDMVIFYFSNETVQPITLLELGKHMHDDHLLVCVHPEYMRKLDVEVQVGLVRDDVVITNDIKDLAQQIKAKIYTIQRNELL